MRNRDLLTFAGLVVLLTTIQVVGSKIEESHVSTVAESSVSESTISDNSISKNSISTTKSNTKKSTNLIQSPEEIASEYRDRYYHFSGPNPYKLSPNPATHRSKSKSDAATNAEVQNADTYICAEYQVYVYDICAQYDNVEPELILALIEKESGGDAEIVGGHGKYLGLMQINPKYQTDRMEDLGVTDLLDAESNIKVGVDYLSTVISDNNGNIAVALMRYNGDSRAFEKGYTSGYARHILNRAAELDGCIKIDELVPLVDSVPEASVSENSISMNSISENSVSVNSIN